MEKLLAKYRRAGLTRVSHRFYPEARHEIMNETNRAEVLTDIVAWLDANLAREARPAAVEGAALEANAQAYQPDSRA